MLLLTGGSGLVGRNLAAALADSVPIVIMTRNPANRNAIYGDLRLDGFGMEVAALDALRSQITEIIHCAAEIKFNVTLDAARDVNTRGAARLLDFAAECPKLEKIRPYQHAVYRRPRAGPGY